MRTIVAGGRDYELTEEDHKLLDALTITVVISGCARGADAGGEEYAASRDIPILRVPAKWNKYGKRAGYLRNQEMGELAEAVVLFPGGRGTQHMFEIADTLDLVIYDFRRP